MGSWDESIMGGDTAMDAESCLFELTGLDYMKHLDGEYSPSQIKEGYTKALPKLFKEAEESNCHITKMTLSVIAMDAGVDLNDQMKKVLQLGIEGAQEELGNEEELNSWRDRTAREARLNEFIQICRSYNGTPTKIPSVGLFEKILGS